MSKEGYSTNVEYNIVSICYKTVLMLDEISKDQKRFALKVRDDSYRMIDNGIGFYLPKFTEEFIGTFSPHFDHTPGIGYDFSDGSDLKISTEQFSKRRRSRYNINYSLGMKISKNKLITKQGAIRVVGLTKNCKIRAFIIDDKDYTGGIYLNTGHGTFHHDAKIKFTDLKISDCALIKKSEVPFYKIFLKHKGK